MPRLRLRERDCRCCAQFGEAGRVKWLNGWLERGAYSRGAQWRHPHTTPLFIHAFLVLFRSVSRLENRHKHYLLDSQTTLLSGCSCLVRRFGFLPAPVPQPCAFIPSTPDTSLIEQIEDPSESDTSAGIIKIHHSHGVLDNRPQSRLRSYQRRQQRHSEYIRNGCSTLYKGVS
jgi:hypothetical protein